MHYHSEAAIRQLEKIINQQNCHDECRECPLYSAMWLRNGLHTCGVVNRTQAELNVPLTHYTESQSRVLFTQMARKMLLDANVTRMLSSERTLLNAESHDDVASI